MTDFKVVGYSRKPSKKDYYDVCITVGKTENYVGEFCTTVAIHKDKLKEFGIDDGKGVPVLNGIISSDDFEIRSKLKDTGWHKELWLSKKIHGYI